jgi:major membrane immunogen (membrane-anchored lipoprotein)
MRKTYKLVASLCVLSALAACRPEDANRPTAFTPGVYKGEAMPTLNKQQIEDLNKRGMLLR